MFCPKCGTKNPDDGKYCRSCGVDLGNVSAAMSGALPARIAGGSPDAGVAHIDNEAMRRKDPNEVYGDGVKGVITGLGFLIVAMALFFTGVANGDKWWWAMLFPAFFGFAKGVSDLMKAQRMSGHQPAAFHPPNGNTFDSASQNAALPPPQTQFVAPESSYRTGDLVPPSVTDNTTRHLEINSEGETMALPKK